MSWWTYVMGVVKVSVSGRTTEQTEYIIKTVLNHLPKVTGSEGNMRVILSSSFFWPSSQGWDEFGEETNNLNDGPFEINENFLLTVEAELRDRHFEDTVREFVHWLCRLAKRVSVDDICVKINDHISKEILITEAGPYTNMFEIPPKWVEQFEGPRWWDEIERKKR